MIRASQFSHSHDQFSATAQVMLSMHQSLATSSKPVEIPSDMVIKPPVKQIPQRDELNADM
jgi:hypothetical protein